MDASTTQKRTRAEQCKHNAQAKSEQKQRTAFEALGLLQQEGKPITKAAVAKRAGVSVVFLRSHPDLAQAIEEEDYPNSQIDFAWKIGSMDYAWNYHPPQPPKPIQSFRDVRAILQRETLCPLWLGRRHATQDSFQPH